MRTNNKEEQSYYDKLCSFLLWGALGAVSYTHLDVYKRQVQYLAGHESSKITMDIYAKVKYNRPDELVRSMSCAFASWDVAQ